MKTNLFKLALMMLLAAVIGIQGVDAQSTINKPPKPSGGTGSHGTGGRGNGGRGNGGRVTTTRDPMDGVTITSMKIGNVSYNGDLITYYGNTLYEDDMKYAKPQLTYNCTRTVSEVTLYTKIFRPSGEMITNSYSPDGYTTSDETDFITGTGMTVALPGWGDDDGGYYPRGTYRWEIWYKGKKLASTYFTVYKGGVTGSGSGSGDGSFEFYGTTREYTDNATALGDITSQIREWGDKGCRTGAITENERGVAVYGENGYVFTGAIPQGMKDAIKDCNKNKNHIVDLTVTDSGYWCVVWSKNKYRGNMPSKMSELMKQYERDGEEIYSVSICENGNFSIVTDKHFYASHETDHANLKRALEKFGTIRSCCVTNKGIVICCDRGVYYKEIPTNLETALKEQSFRIKVVKYTDSGTYLITDGDKRRAWYM